MNNIPFEIFQNFNEIKYYDEPHKYFLGIDEYISVTTLIHKYQEEFDENYWSNYKANEFNVPQWKIKRAWDFINKKGTMKGSIIHDYAENAILNKIFEYPQKEIYNEFGFDPIYPEYLITKKHVDKFLQLSKNKLIPIKTELVVRDVESKVAGMVDLLFYNVKENELQIWDYKTNKRLTRNNPNKTLLGIFDSFDDCDLELYSLQMEAYKYIIEKNTSLKLGKSYLIWVSHNNSSFEIIEGLNRRYFIQEMFNERINNLNK
jgi:hypothetical protein